MGLSAAPIDSFDISTKPSAPEQFDLITFPEAFVPADKLMEVLASLNSYGPLGCIHVGLRPSEDKNHLFTLLEAKVLVDGLTKIDISLAEDLASFTTWLNGLEGDFHLNLGCLFAIDANQRLRICLHPKAVRSQFETAPLLEEHMYEAKFLSLITLSPRNKQFLSVTLQPLICSDALRLETDLPDGWPIEAVNRFADCFGDTPPDHIDIVSLATCTPQPQDATNGSPYREWQEQFQNTFKETQTTPDLARHHFSIFVFSNFRTLRDNQAGGLSGVFLPMPPKYKNFSSEISVSCWGKPLDSKTNNSWSKPDDNALEKWTSRGFIAGINPFPDVRDAIVRIFDFTIHRLPRQRSLWAKQESLTECKLRIGRTNKKSGKIEFTNGNINYEQ
jgi:hypothetical protein